MMTVLLVAVLCTLTGLTSSSLPQLSELCPYIDVCNKETDESHKHNVSRTCCAPCSCSDTCTLTGTCCPDKQNHLNSSPVFPCRTLKQIYNKYLNRNISSYMYGAHDYRIIDECASEYKITKINDASISRCKEFTELSDLIFVTSRQSGHTYLNRYCATCNGEDDFVEWNLYFTGPFSELQFISFEERNEFVLTNLYFRISPPSDPLALNAVCSVFSYRTCNATGLWDYYDKELEKKCSSYENYFSVDNFINQESFENVYCFMCNFGRGTVIPKQCNTLNDIIETEVRSDYSSFKALLIVNKKEDPSVQHQSDCATGEIEDQIFNKCTDLICPPGTIPRYSICEPMVDILYGYVVRVRFKLALEANINAQTIDHSALLDDFVRFARNLTRRNGFKCGVCSMALGQIQDHDKLILEIDIRSVETCNHVALLENIFVTFKAMPVAMFSRSLKDNVTLSYLIDSTNYLNRILAFKSYTQCRSIVYYTPELVHCPSLIFDKSNISEKCSNDCFQRKIDPFAFPLGNGQYMICVHRYMEAFSGGICVYCTGWYHFTISTLSVVCSTISALALTMPL